MLDTSASVDVTAPSAAPSGGWTTYIITPCINGGGCSTSQECQPVNDPGITACTLTNLLPNTAFTVKVAAVAGSLTSLTGTDATLTTRISCVCGASWLGAWRGWGGRARSRGGRGARGSLHARAKRDMRPCALTPACLLGCPSWHAGLPP